MALVEFNSTNKNLIISDIDVAISKINEVLNSELFEIDIMRKEHGDEFFKNRLEDYKRDLRTQINRLQNLKKAINNAEVFYKNKIEDLNDDISKLGTFDIIKRGNRIY